MAHKEAPVHKEVNNSGSPYDPEPGAPAFDETSVFINVQRVGGTEMPAVIKDRTAYLPVNIVFDFLKIKNELAPGLDSVSGYFIEPSARFCIDYRRLQIRYKGAVFLLQESDLIQTESNLYLRAEYFNQVFGLACAFDFSNLTVKVSATVDLPAVREAQMEQMHRNVSRLKGEQKADTVIRRSYPFFNMGMADWSLNATQQLNGSSDMRAGLALGAILAGGELNVFLNYYSHEPFRERQQFYQWRLANNDRKYLRQATAGRIFTGSTASISDPVVGIQLTNTPTTYRRSAGTYRLSKTTQPGWTVELYVNNVLVDYVKADASGFFTFDVPLVYGNSVVKLRYYGLYGEERTTEENIAIPFNFLPKGELEYTLSVGRVEDTLGSCFSRGSLSYGVNRFITIGAGTEYLSSVPTGQMPYLNASLRLSSSIMLSAEYTHGVRGKSMLTYRMPHNAQLELAYTRYAEGQRAIVYNNLEERKLSYSIPYAARRFSGITRLLFNQVIITDNTSYTTAEWLISGNLRTVGANFNTYLVSAGQKDPPRFDPYVYTNAAVNWRFARGYNLSPQAQYSYREGAFISAKCELEKYLFSRGYLNISYERNFRSDVYSFGAGLRYDLSFMRVGFAARHFNDGSAATATASGSLIGDARTRDVMLSNRPSVGRAGITLLAFLDLNANGHHDDGEPRVSGLKVRISSGRVAYSKRDTVLRLYDLEPYTAYFLDISQNAFENIGWQIRNKTLNVAVDPNTMKLIEIPVAVMAEASGSIYLKGDGGAGKGLGRISMCFYREDGTQAGCTLSDPDGYYSFMGLPPGNYTVRPDAAQLAALHMSASPASRSISIAPSRDGVMVEGQDFTLRK